MDLSDVVFQQEEISPSDFLDILGRSGLADRRPVSDVRRLERMLRGANLIVTARLRSSKLLVGVARGLTDYSYACYISDIAVDRSFVGRGIGTRLIEVSHQCAGDECVCVLVSAPEAVGFYERIGMARSDRAFLRPRSG